MYINKMCGCVLTELNDIKSTAQIKGLLDTYTPETSKSILWKYWKATLAPKLCLECASHHGKIYAIDELPDIEPPLHPNCRCTIDRMDAIVVGGATKDGENGADYWLVHYGKLPDYYISEDDLCALGWRHGKPPKRFAPGKMFLEGSMITTMVISLQRLDVSGMRQISITMKGGEMVIASFFQMMG